MSFKVVYDIIHREFIKNRDLYEYFGNAICYTITFEEAKVIVNDCSKCKCCKIHQTKRPTKLDTLGEEPVAREKSIEELEQRCQCCCRSFSRYLCRIYGDIKFDNEENERP